MNRFVFYIFLLANVFIAKAQENLVPNGSFEDLSDCPFDALAVSKAKGWFSPSIATPDIYNECSDFWLNNSVPSNGLGYQEAFDGAGYIGIVPYGSGTDYREYVACKLVQKLKAGAVYEASYFVSLAESSPIATNLFGFGFMVDSAFYSTTLQIHPYKVLQSDVVVLDSVNWIKISVIFEASGNENYMAVGSFSNDLDSKTIVIDNSSSDCYYFLDSVSLKEISINFENVFTPNGDGTNDLVFFYEDIAYNFTVDIYNRWGQAVASINTKDGWNGTDNNNRLLNSGVYFYQVALQNETIFKDGFIHLIR